MPEGAFYVYAGCERFAEDSEALRGGCSRKPALRSRRGSTSASIGRALHVRFAYTRSLVDIEEGVERLGRLLGRPA